jgi:hypothetical protein
VHVVGVAVVGEGRDDDRAEARRAPRCHLQPGEPAPRDAHQAGAPSTPRLLGQPGQRGLDVAVLLFGVLVAQHAVRVAAAPQVQAQAGIAMPCEVRVVDRVAHGGEIALAVRDGLADGRHRVAVGRHRPPEPGGELGAVGHRDAEGLGGADLVRERADDTHQANS